MREATACQRCRQSKRKCHRSAAGEACKQCVRRQAECSFKSKLKAPPRLWPLRAATKSAQLEGLGQLDMRTEIIEELVEHYLQNIHERPHSLFHPATLRADIRKGKVHPALQAALCAMGSRFSADPEIFALEPKLIAQAKRLLKEDLENVCLELIQTCILVADLCAAHSNATSAALFFRIANGMAQILKLTTVDSQDTLVMQEIKKRVWWSLFMADRWCSSGFGICRQLKDLDRSTDLPMDEFVFRSLHANQRRLHAPWIPGLWAHMITLVEIFGPIQDINFRLAHGDCNQDDISRQVYELSQKLCTWHETLPDHRRLTERNLLDHVSKGLGGAFVALHFGYHHYSTLLYFQYLDAGRPSTEMTAAYANRCKKHASSFSSILKRARQQEGCEAVWPSVGHCAIVSSSVLLHTLLFGEEHELPEVRRGLNDNFEALIELTRYWPCLKVMIDRLDKFQNMCLVSAHLPTYSVDQWMVRFLIEYALPLDGNDSNLLASLEREMLSKERERSAKEGRLTTFPLAALEP